jgi:hypothetical protein
MVASSETIQSVVDTYLQAAEANRNTPARDGNVIALSPDTADDVTIAGDLHGHRLNFKKLCRIADLESHTRRHLVLQEVCHGGPSYPSGLGCMSHLLLEDVAKLKVRYPERCHFLLSNHELAELDNLPITKAGQMLNMQFRAGMHEMYDKAIARVRDAMDEFLSTCPLAVRLSSDIFICHGAPEGVAENGFDTQVFRRPLVSQDLQSAGAAFSLVWGRDFRPENAEAFAELVGADVLIHGHEPCSEGFATPNDRQIILDCAGTLASYVILPTGERLTHSQVMQRIRRLHGNAE